MHGIGPRSPFKQASQGSGLGDQPNGLFKTRFEQRIHRLVGELKIVTVLGDAAGAVGAGLLDGMADVDNDAECRTLAICGFDFGGFGAG